MNSYAPVTGGRILEPGMRCTAFYYVTRRGLPTTFSYLLELGLRASRLGRWYGLRRVTTSEGYPDNPLQVLTWPERIWDEAAGAMAPCSPVPPPQPVPSPPPAPPAPYARPDSPHPMVHDVLALQRRYGDPPPPPEPRLTAWQYADEQKMLTGEGDPAFVAELDSAAAYVAARRGVPWEPHWTGGVVSSAWPESLWRDVSGAMAQRGAEKGDTDLDDLELDAVADGYLPEPEYRPGAKPSPAQFMAHYDDGSLGNENSFWSYPPPPEDTQAYLDWTQMASDADREYGPWVNANYESDCDGCSSRIWAGDAIRADGRGGWLCAICGDEDAQPYETRDAGWGEGQPPWDGDDINHSAWDPGWPPMSSEDM